MEPYDSHYVRTVHGNVLAKRAYNTFPNWDDSDKDNARFTQIRQAQRDGVEMAEVPRDNLDSVAYESYFRPDDKDKVRQVFDIYSRTSDLVSRYTVMKIS